MKVTAMLDKLRPSSDIKYVAWGTIKRKSVYGWTEAQVRRQLVSVEFCGEHVTVHRKIAAELEHIQGHIRRWERLNKAERWTPERIEAFNWRAIRGGTSLSRHAHAIALDIDPAHNAYNGSTTNIPRHVLQIFINHGWCWGGSWKSPVDPMHLQRH